MYSAVKMGGGRRARGLKRKQVEHMPAEKMAALVEQYAWYFAKKLAAVMFPQNPLGTEELSEHDQWVLLETVALTLAPTMWDNPNAIGALYELRKKFNPGAAQPELLVAKRLAEKEKRMTPSPDVVPIEPEFKRRMDAFKR